MDKNLAYYINHPEKAMEISESEIRAWLEQYPYSAAVRMLRARKSLDGLSPSSKEDIITAADYVSDPLFLYYQLLRDAGKEGETLDAIREWKEYIPQIPEKSPKEEAEVKKPAAPSTPDRSSDKAAQVEEPPGKEEAPEPIKPPAQSPSKSKSQGIPNKDKRKTSPKAVKAPRKSQQKKEQKPVDEKTRKEEIVKAALKSQKSAPLTFSSWLTSLEPIELKDNPVQSPKSKKKKKKKSKKKSRLDKLITQSIAEKEEAISETYADLLISQGYTDKARDVLRKLILKFPEKSGYFAAKIENLDKE